MDLYSSIFLVIILIVSFVARNITYGYVANWLGDPTARLSGRITPNPFSHIDLLGTIIVPGLLIFSGTGLILGWPKPVPYNVYNFTNQKWGEAILGVSGSVTNFGIAAVFALLLRFAPELPVSFIDISVDIILLNLFLAFFNLLPIPPLDGAKIISNLLPLSASLKYNNFIRYLENNSLLSFFIIFFLFLYVIGGVFFSATVYVGAFMSGIDINTFFSFYR